MQSKSQLRSSDSHILCVCVCVFSSSISAPSVIKYWAANKDQARDEPSGLMDVTAWFTPDTQDTIVDRIKTKFENEPWFCERSRFIKAPETHGPIEIDSTSSTTRMFLTTVLNINLLGFTFFFC